MKKVALLIAMTLVFTSCSWLNDTPAEETKTPEVKVENEVKTPDTDEKDNETPDEETENQVENTPEEEMPTEIPTVNEITEPETPVIEVENEEETSSDESITDELANGTEDEQLLNEVFNEINEVFELVEQNGGQ